MVASLKTSMNNGVSYVVRYIVEGIILGVVSDDKGSKFTNVSPLSDTPVSRVSGGQDENLQH